MSNERSAMASREMEKVQAETQQKVKEIKDLRLAHGKVQKVLAEKGTELSHALRKAEAYEREVRHNLN